MIASARAFVREGNCKPCRIYHFFPCFFMARCSAFSPALCESRPLCPARVRLVAVSRLIQRCLGTEHGVCSSGHGAGVLLFSRALEDGFLCIIHCCLGRLVGACVTSLSFLRAGASQSLWPVSISLLGTWEQAQEKPSSAASLLQYSLAHFILHLGRAGQVVGSTML